MSQEPEQLEPEPPAAEPRGPSEEDEPKSYAPIFFRTLIGISLSVVLLAGVAWAGRGDVASWGSALIGLLILVMVLLTSGTTGWWDR